MSSGNSKKSKPRCPVCKSTTYHRSLFNHRRYVHLEIEGLNGHITKLIRKSEGKKLVYYGLPDLVINKSIPIPPIIDSKNNEELTLRSPPMMKMSRIIPTSNFKYKKQSIQSLS
eukprot:97617_1